MHPKILDKTNQISNRDMESPNSVIINNNNNNNNNDFINKKKRSTVGSDQPKSSAAPHQNNDDSGDDSDVIFVDEIPVIKRKKKLRRLSFNGDACTTKIRNHWKKVKKNEKNYFVAAEIAAAAVATVARTTKTFSDIKVDKISVKLTKQNVEITPISGRKIAESLAETSSVSLQSQVDNTESDDVNDVNDDVYQANQQIKRRIVSSSSSSSSSDHETNPESPKSDTTVVDENENNELQPLTTIETINGIDNHNGETNETNMSVEDAPDFFLNMMNEPEVNIEEEETLDDISDLLEDNSKKISSSSDATEQQITIPNIEEEIIETVEEEKQKSIKDEECSSISTKEEEGRSISKKEEEKEEISSISTNEEDEKEEGKSISAKKEDDNSISSKEEEEKSNSISTKEQEGSREEGKIELKLPDISKDGKLSQFYEKISQKSFIDDIGTESALKLIENIGIDDESRYSINGVMAIIECLSLSIRHHFQRRFRCAYAETFEVDRNEIMQSNDNTKS